MKAKQFHTVIRMKNEVIIEKTRRIKLLEDKLDEMRHRYFELKYHDAMIDNPQPHFHGHRN